MQFANGGESAARVDAGAEVYAWLIGCRRDDEGHLKCRFVAEGVCDLHGEGEGAGLKRNPNDAPIGAQLQALRQGSGEELPCEWPESAKDAELVVVIISPTALWEP